MSKSGNCYPARNDILRRLRSLSRRNDFITENKNMIDVTCVSNILNKVKFNQADYHYRNKKHFRKGNQSEKRMMKSRMPIFTSNISVKNHPIRNADDEIGLAIITRIISQKTTIYKDKSEIESIQYYFSYYFPKQPSIFKIQMDKRTSGLTADSATEIEKEENQRAHQEKVEVRKALNLLVRYFLNPTQIPKSNNGSLTSGNQRNEISDKYTLKNNKSTFRRSLDNPSKMIKTDHKSVLESKGEIQSLIDFNSARIELRKFPKDPFSKSREMYKYFRLIILDKEPVATLVLCYKCRKLLVRYRPSGTNLIRHYQRHMNSEEEKDRETRQSGNTIQDDYRKKRAAKFPKFRTSKDNPDSEPRKQRNELPSDENDQSLSPSSGILSGVHPQEEALNIISDPAIPSLPAARDLQVTSQEGDSKEGLVMLVDHPILMEVGMDNTQVQTCAQIANIKRVEPFLKAADGSSNPDHETGLLNIETAW